MASVYTYIPNADADRVIWFHNFSSKIGVYAQSLGISAGEVNSVQDDYNMFAYVINLQELHKQVTYNITSYKKLLMNAVKQQHIGAVPTLPALPTAPRSVPEGVFDRVSKLVKRIKASINYNYAIGQDLGIIAPSPATDYANIQPKLKVTLNAGKPHIKCAKGIAGAMDLFVNRNDGLGWVLIGRLLKTEYIDTVALPADTKLSEWNYKAMFVIGNDNVGIMSQVVSVVVKKM